MSLDLSVMLSDKIQAMSESATIKMAQKARELAAKGVKVISLSLGEPDFDTPQYIKDAAAEGLAKGYTKYTPVSGLAELKKAIVSKFKRENDLEYTEKDIVVSTGAKQSIANVFLSTVNPGDEVIIFAPYWVSYVELVKFCGGIPVVVGAGIDQDFKVNAQQVAAAINDKTKVIIFSSPCNPTGSLYSQEELESIAQVILPHNNLIVISDEIYEHINFVGKHASIATIPGMKEITAVVNGFSKGYSMTGWRLGYMAAPQWLAAACDKVQGQITSGASSFSQYAAAIALEGDQTPTREMTAAFLTRKKLVLELLSQIPGVKVNNPQGAFYVFPDISYYFGKSNGELTINNADDFCEIMLAEAHVGCVSGSAFGNDDCIRISYAASEENLRTAIGNLHRVLTTFK
ncbi:MAG: pyridoxal phosphate-dependent aminotransferase [Saprospiraceae bacterium]|nr:pyridoxal phosphate-dependent aminotransferase [Saprospiraceae bacterium]